uniref:Uncharacterized protein n=1 Tax=Ixodes ricinus TaxID=34613 RepID=A0A6B0VEI5_IXORI
MVETNTFVLFLLGAMATHFDGTKNVTLDETEASHLLDSMEVLPQENVQEYVGARKDSAYQKYIYRLVLDFDGQPTHQELSMDNVIVRAGKVALHIAMRYKPYIACQNDRNIFLVNAILTSRIKNVDGTDVERWHMHFTNIVFIDSNMRNGAQVLTPVRTWAKRDIEEDWPDFNVSAGSLQRLVYGSREVDATSSYKYVNSIQFCVDTSTETVSLKNWGPRAIPNKMLRHLLSVHREINDNDIVIDWNRVPSDAGTILSTRVQYPEYTVASRSTEWGDILVSEDNMVEVVYPQGRPPFLGTSADLVENSPATCIELAKAYKGVLHRRDSESKSSADAREYVYGWALMRLATLAQYATTYDKWYRLLLIIASNMNYHEGLRRFRVFCKLLEVEKKKDRPEHQYNRAVAWLWKYTPVECLSSGRKKNQKRKRRGSDDNEEGSDDNEDDENRRLNVPRRIVRIQYEPYFQMTEEDKETSKWLLTELAKGMNDMMLVYKEYIKRLLSFKYNEIVHATMSGSLNKLLLELDMVAFKTCFEYESANDNTAPFDLCYKFLVKSRKCHEEKTKHLYAYTRKLSDMHSN